MRAVVTGATGFVGSALVERLRLGAHTVVGVVSDRWAPGPDQVVADLRDGPALTAAIERAEPQLIVHLAAMATRSDARASDGEVFRLNAEGTAAVLDAASRCSGAVRVVVASTDALSRTGPPVDPYERSKAAAEAIVAASRDQDGLDVVIARLSNIYGPGDRSRHRLVPSVALAERDGTTFVPDHPDALVDLVHVDDVVAALAMLGSGTGAEPIHRIASGSMVTVAAVVQAVRDLGRGRLIPPIASSGYDRAVPVVPGWAPAITLEAGLAETVRWYREASHQGAG